VEAAECEILFDRLQIGDYQFCSMLGGIHDFDSISVPEPVITPSELNGPAILK